MSDLSKIAVEGAKEIIELRRQRDQLLSAATDLVENFHEYDAQIQISFGSASAFLNLRAAIAAAESKQESA